MNGHTLNCNREAAGRPMGWSRALLALLCVLGMFAALLQPSYARASLNAVQADVVQTHSVKGGKPCQRAAPGALGVACGAGALIGLEIKTSTLMEPAPGVTGVTPFADKLLHVQWLAAPQFRPPRIGA